MRNDCVAGLSKGAASGSSERAAPTRRSIAIPPGPSEEDPGAAHVRSPVPPRNAARAYWLGIVQSFGTMWIQV